MTLEQWLLIAFLLAVPLLDRLMRALRERESRLPQGDRPPRPPLPERPAPRRPLPGRGADENEDEDEGIWPPPHAPQRLPPRRPAPERLVTRERTRERGDRRERTATRPPPPRAPQRAPQRVRQDTALRAIRGAAGLRRAIVLMTILGPCRALPPDDAAHRTG